MSPNNDHELTNLEELNLLKRTIQSQVFHFIVVQYNHYSLVHKTKDFLKNQYPNLTHKTFELTENEVVDFMSDLLVIQDGIVYIERAENLLNDSYKSISIGLNQRRDKFTFLPLNIILFLPTDTEILRQLKRLMPDVYSIINPIIYLNIPIETSVSNLPVFKNDMYSNVEEANQDIQRITDRLDILETQEDNLPLVIRLSFNLAKAYHTVGKFEQVLDLLLNLKQKITVNDVQNINQLNNELGLIYKDLGDLQQAKTYMEKALASNEKSYGENHPSTAITYSNLGSIYNDLGDLLQAKSYIEKSYKIFLDNFGEDHPKSKIAYNNLQNIKG